MVDTCKHDALAEFRRLELKIKERLQWVWHATSQINHSLPWNTELALEKKKIWCRESYIHWCCLCRHSASCGIHHFLISCSPWCKASVASIQDELNYIVDYARRYLPIDSVCYRIGVNLYVSLDCTKLSNVLLLAKLIFSLTFTTSHIKQLC